MKSGPVALQYWDNTLVILTTAMLSVIMTAPLFAVQTFKLARRVLDDDTIDYITVQIKEV